MGTELQLVHWTEDLSVGIPAVDADHKVLIDLLNQIVKAKDGPEPISVIGTVLNVLGHYTDYHFTREELVQAAGGYPGLAAHHRIHESLKESVEQYRSRFMADPASVDIDDLYVFLKDWLVEHIMSEDKAFAPYVANTPEAEAAAESVHFVSLDDIDFDDMENDPFMGGRS
ncbi:MAG: bacteriohemerythrin [Magnetospirillum sp. WYHS-4]